MLQSILSTAQIFPQLNFSSTLQILALIFLLIMVILAAYGVRLHLEPQTPQEPSLDKLNDLDSVADTAINEVKTRTPRIITPVLRAAKSKQPSGQINLILQAKNCDDNPTPRKHSATTFLPIARKESSTPPSILIRHAIPISDCLNAPSTPVHRAPLAHADDFEKLRRTAPESFKTLQKGGWFEKDGTPTRKLLDDGRLPWGRDTLCSDSQKKVCIKGEEGAEEEKEERGRARWRGQGDV